MKYETLADSNGIDPLVTVVRSISLQQKTIEFYDSWIASFWNVHNFVYYSISSVSSSNFSPNNVFTPKGVNVLMLF
jgi:hypothetical protein